MKKTTIILFLCGICLFVGASIAHNTYAFAPAQISVLDAIAHQCPLSGEQAVFDARSLYAWVAGAQFYDDTGNCVQQGLNYRQSQAEAPEIYKVYPNPTDGEITVVLPKQLSTAIFTLYSAQGVKLGQWECTNTDTHIAVDKFPSGMYFYTLDHLGTVLYTHTLSIQ